MIKKLIQSLILLSVCSNGLNAFADSASYKQQFFYVGLMTGYANVDYGSTVATDSDSAMSSPTSANGYGALGGVDMGYQFNPHFAMEAEFARMPNAHLTYEQSLLQVYNAPANVTTNNYFAAIIFKVMAPIGHSNFSLFADAGPAFQYTKIQDGPLGGGDFFFIHYTPLQDTSTFSPTFGGGVLYRIANHWQAEASFQYAPGTGKSVINPMDYYVPELYAGTFKINYIF